jgi:endoglycosylceramidase
MRAWRAFFADEQDIQTRYVAMVRHVSSRLRRTTAVAGYDVMNEPNALTPDQNAALSKFYAKALKAIRSGGSRQLVLFEPSVLFSATGSGAPPAFKHDRNVVYAPHIYTGGFTGGPIPKAAFTTVRSEAKKLGGVPVLSGEWGTDPDRASRTTDTYFADHQRFQDEFGFSAALWTWRESCGDPHKVAEQRAGSTPKPWGLFDVDCRTNRVTGERTALRNQLTRGYVRAAPARYTTTWDPAKGRLEASGRAPRKAAPVVAYFPQPSGTGRVIQTKGAAEFPRLERLTGGGLLISFRPRPGRWKLTVSRR